MLKASTVLAVLFAATLVSWEILNRIRVAHYEDIFVRTSRFLWVPIAEDTLVWVAAFLGLSLAVTLVRLILGRDVGIQAEHTGIPEQP